MKSFSFFTILLLCVAILIVDVLAYYWLITIIASIEPVWLQTAIKVLFWLFTVGLITAIMILKMTLDAINPARRHFLISKFYGLAISSFVPKLVFVTMISILFFTNQLLSDNESLVLVPILGLFSGFLPFFIIVYGIYIAKYRFKVYHHVVKSDRLPEAFDGLKVIQISDLHLGSFNYNYHKLERAVEMINKELPDYIMITGDLVNNYAWELRGWESVFKKLNDDPALINEILL